MDARLLIDKRMSHRCHRYHKLVEANRAFHTRKDILSDKQPTGKMELPRQLNQVQDIKIKSRVDLLLLWTSI